MYPLNTGWTLRLLVFQKIKSNSLPDTSIGLLVDNTLTGEEYELQYAGAHNPLLIFRGTEYFQLKATSRSLPTLHLINHKLGSLLEGNKNCIGILPESP